MANEVEVPFFTIFAVKSFQVGWDMKRLTMLGWEREKVDTSSVPSPFIKNLSDQRRNSPFDMGPPKSSLPPVGDIRSQGKIEKALQSTRSVWEAASEMEILM